MFIRKLFQSRLFLFLFALIPLLLSINHYYSKYSLLNDHFNENNFQIKIIEINDRQPTYKLATYEGYQFPLERNLAQTELFQYLKLQQICQNNSNTTVIDIGASLGFYFILVLFYFFIFDRRIWFICCCMWM